MRTADTKPFERFDADTSVPISGQLLVGLRLGPSRDPFSPSAIGVSVSSRPSTDKLCLGIASRDGRYAAEVLFDVIGDAGFATFTFESQFKDRVANYKQDAIGILIREVDKCSSPDEGTILPSVGETDTRPNSLHASINAAAERLTVALELGPNEVEPAVCVGDRSKVSIAFSSVCSWQLPARALEGEFKLRVSVRERFEDVRRTYRVRIHRP